MKAKIILTIIISIIFLNSFAQKQIKITKLDLKKLPKGVNYEGKIKTAIRFVDILGSHIIITSETGVYHNSKFQHLEDGRDAELFGYHYLENKGKINLVWRVYDLIQDCPFDVYVNYIPNTFQITDLNNDDICEVWLMYKTSCRSDVSPAEMKIIMYQNQQKFAIRGQNKVKVGEKEYVGGSYKFDKNFLEGPKEFRDFASNLWKSHILETWGKTN